MVGSSHKLTHDSQAILLLCGHLGSNKQSGARPLSLADYRKLTEWLKARGARPGELLLPDNKLLGELDGRPLPRERVQALLERGAQLAIALEKWAGRGLWVLTRSDTDYPRRLKARLGHEAPPILFGIGNRILLDQGGVAIVGSRDVDLPGLQFTKTLAERCADEGMSIISGGARGVDTEAMLAAVRQGGNVVGVLADNLARAAVSSKFRNALREGRMVLISPYDPDAGFNVGNAMGRNKYIYVLSEAAVVVASAAGSGGTWAGAVENLSAKWVPLLVRDEPGAPPGNKKLLEMRAGPLSAEQIASPDLKFWLHSLSYGSDPAVALDPHVPAVVPEPPAAEEARPGDLFPVVWPYIEHQLRSPRSAHDLARYFNVTPTQMRDWLTKAVSQGLAEETKKPVRYSLPCPNTPPNGQMTLFTL